MSDPNENTSMPLEELATIGKYPTLEQAQEHGLVILAMNEACWVAETNPPGGYTLHAEPQPAERIADELQAYENEREIPLPVRPFDQEMFRFGPGWGIYGIWMATLILVFLRQNVDPSLVERAASSSRGLISSGEWWRPFTGLFLHADAPHLIGNLLSGLLFGSLVSRSIGPLRGWALILACGTIGNILTSSITYPDPFVSIGASTAVFAALGILSGLGFTAMMRLRVRLQWAKLTAPLVAGIVLLGWLGGGSHGGNTDVLGHVFGFSSGLTAGLSIGLLSPNTAGTLAAGTSSTARGGLA
jgi:rhomboid protease GluP